MTFPAHPPTSKEEMLERLQTIEKHRMTLDPAVMKLYDACGFTVFMRSVIPCSGGEIVIRDAMKKCRPRVALVIGTNRGVSTAFVAIHCEKVYTIDVIGSDIRPKIWKTLGVEKKIEDFVVPDNKAKYALIKRLSFDFAFADGDHANDAESDFEAVKKCGNVLVHEYWDASPVKAHMDSVREGCFVKMGGNFAFWQASMKQEEIEPVLESIEKNAGIVLTDGVDSVKIKDPPMEAHETIPGPAFEPVEPGSAPKKRGRPKKARE